ncbi:MAG: hypothetical protein P8123_11250, partial [bacterium]
LTKLDFMKSLIPLIKAGVVIPLPYNFLVPSEPPGDHLDYLTRENLHLLKCGYRSIYENRKRILFARKIPARQIASIIGDKDAALDDGNVIAVGFHAEGTSEIFFKEEGNTVQRNTGLHIERVSRRHGDWPEYLALYCLLERIDNVLNETGLAFLIGARYFTESPTSWELVAQLSEGLPELLHFFRSTRAKAFADIQKQIKNLSLTHQETSTTNSSQGKLFQETTSNSALTSIDLPYLDGLTFPDVIKLRDDDAFGRCRDALRRLNRHTESGSPITPSPVDIQRVVKEEITPVK